MPDNFNYSGIKTETNLGNKIVSQEEVRQATYRFNHQGDSPLPVLEALGEISRNSDRVVKPKPKTKQLTRKRKAAQPIDAIEPTNDQQERLKKAASEDLKKRNLK